MGLLDFPRLKTQRMIDYLREKYPEYTWTYNPHAHWWECEVGRVSRVAALAPRYDGDDDTFRTETWFYFNEKGKRPERVY